MAAPRTLSILFHTPQSGIPAGGVPEPDFFADLNLDQLVGSLTQGRAEYDLADYFHLPLSTVDAVEYRHEVLDDLRDDALFESIESFAETMRTVRGNLSRSDGVYYAREKERWFLDAVDVYCRAVRALSEDLASTAVRSRALTALRDYLSGYLASAGFTGLVDETARLLADLSRIRYSLDIKGDRIRVTDYYGEPDYSADVLATFERFEQDAAHDYLVRFHDDVNLNHVEAAVLDMVARLNPAVFHALREYRVLHDGFLDETVRRFDREVQFYLAYLGYASRLEAAGLAFCCPRVSDLSKEVCAVDTFDIVLAGKLVDEGAPVVRNDLSLSGAERIFVVTGPNHGGKTTFARTFGQLHYLASLGLPVPGSTAQLYLPDRIFTQFERQEDPTDHHGKLEGDLLRVHGVFEQASARSIVILNEIFTSTTLADAVYLGTKIIEGAMELDLLCVCVTFVDELASLGASTVSMVSTVDPADPAVRTFKVVRRPADGLAYAAALAQKYGLSHDQLRERIAS
jgi:DNA mismatch repair ATPase MutS